MSTIHIDMLNLVTILILYELYVVKQKSKNGHKKNAF